MFLKVFLKSRLRLKKRGQLIQGLVSAPNFLLVGISHQHAVSCTSDEEHCPCSLALIPFILSFIQKLLGQHIRQLSTRIHVQRKPKPFLFLCLNRTSNSSPWKPMNWLKYKCHCSLRSSWPLEVDVVPWD